MSIAQVYAFLAVAAIYGIRFSAAGYALALPALLLTGMALGAVGLLFSSLIRQLENFSGVMNFVIFPVFFLSSALYPLWKMRESSVFLYWLCALNPFTHMAELIRFALYQRLEPIALAATAGTFVVFGILAAAGYDPRFSMIKRQVS